MELKQKKANAELDPRKNTIKVVICTSDILKTPVLIPYLQQLDETKEYPYETYSGFEEIPLSFPDVAGAVVVLTILNQDELFGAAQYLSVIENQIKTGTIRVILFNRLQHDKLDEFLKLKGVTSILDLTFPIKPFGYKIKSCALFLLKAATFKDDDSQAVVVVKDGSKGEILEQETIWVKGGANFNTKRSFTETKLYFSLTSKNDKPLRGRSCALIEVFQNQAVFQIPVGLLESGDEITFEGRMNRGNKETVINIHGKTEVIKTDGDSQEAKGLNAIAVCKLDHSTQEHLEKMINVLQEQREEYLDFFDEARGNPV